MGKRLRFKDALATPAGYVGWIRQLDWNGYRARPDKIKRPRRPQNDPSPSTWTMSSSRPSRGNRVAGGRPPRQPGLPAWGRCALPVGGMLAWDIWRMI